MTELSAMLRRVSVTGTNLESLEIPCGTPRTHSLACRPGDTFLCLTGTKLDGHDFICTAVEHGASLIICERVTDWLLAHPEVAYVTVENTRLACAHLWNEYYGRPGERMILVAVTGTNGKTSTTYFLREMFRRAGYVTGVIGTVRCMIGDNVRILSDSAESHVNAMTTPAPEQLYGMLAEMADAGVEIVFMEASSHALAQYRLDPLRFMVGIFTGLTPEHLDYHAAMEDYYAAKRRLFSLCSAAVINADDAYAERLLREIAIPTVLYTIAGKTADYAAEALSDQSMAGLTYTFSEKTARQPIRCPVTGGFMAANSMAAASCARLFGISPAVIAEALAECPQIPGRMEHLTLPAACDFDVFIDYAHTPDALENVLRTLETLKKPHGRLVVVFGCGGDRDRTKRPVMGGIAASIADLTVITGDNSRSENPRAITCDILRGTGSGADIKVIERRACAIRWVIANHRPGDLILLAGKGHEDYEIDASGKHPFCEKLIVGEAVSQLYGVQET